MDSLQLSASTENFAKLRSFARDYCARANVGSELCYRVLVVLEELFTNTLKHGYRGTDGPVRIELEQVPGFMSIRYEDAAPLFDPLKADIDDPSISVNKGKIGGMGLLLIHKMADTLSYERQGEWNRIAILMKSA